jgi:hypothetical protein
VVPRDARRLGLKVPRKARRATIGRGAADVPGGGAARVKVRLTRAARRAVGHARLMRVRSTATLIDSAGNEGQAVQKIKLRRKR